MARQERKTHKNFIEYQKFIANHRNYASLPNKFNPAGEITWVRVKDQDRAIWWDALKQKFDLPDRASVARQIHPPELNGLKPCQICGEYLSIHYRYLNSNSMAKLQPLLPIIEQKQFKYTIDELLKIINDSKDVDSSSTNLLAKILGVKPSDLQAGELIVPLKLSNLSPGAMSNAPDRLDGFHTYNACCRSVQDTGRHTSNLSRYAQDRRAYENWSDGDWRGANRLMGKFSSSNIECICPGCGKKAKMTADHIGPISLGFCHRMKFNPLCINCNSGKNNRMTYQNVLTLLNDEAHGETVVSWHSKYIWDKLKKYIKNDADAIALSNLMRTNLHNILILLSQFSNDEGREFLKTYLHPEFAGYDFTFTEFNPAEGTFSASRYEVDSKNTQSNADRYIRVSFESLEEYSTKENRRTLPIKVVQLDRQIANINALIRKKNYTSADKNLRLIINEISDSLISTFKKI